ncbi:hypothetical protein [Candidatus Hydrogenosomobacter endosymbioticus]|nr:hypothetical protein [Candidatus Hydrogenosomobacter endosymbioticus]
MIIFSKLLFEIVNFSSGIQGFNNPVVYVRSLSEKTGAEVGCFQDNISYKLWKKKTNISQFEYVSAKKDEEISRIREQENSDILKIAQYERKNLMLQSVYAISICMTIICALYLLWLFINKRLVIDALDENAPFNYRHVVRFTFAHVLLMLGLLFFVITSLGTVSFVKESISKSSLFMNYYNAHKIEYGNSKDLRSPIINTKYGLLVHMNDKKNLTETNYRDKSEQLIAFVIGKAVGIEDGARKNGQVFTLLSLIALFFLMDVFSRAFMKVERKMLRKKGKGKMAAEAKTA